MLVNAWWQPLDFVLPPTRPQAAWQAEVDSYELARPPAPAGLRRAGDRITLRPRSLIVLRSDQPTSGPGG